MREREYISPDGQLRLLVIAADDDVTIGFADCPAHTHGSILAELFECDEAAAVERFISDILESNAVIAVWRVEGRMKDAWLPAHEGHRLRDVIANLQKYGEPSETVEFRLWNGESIEPD